jgi:hypothetical protein
VMRAINTPPKISGATAQSSDDDFHKPFIRVLSSTMRSVTVHSWRTSSTDEALADGSKGTWRPWNASKYRHN